MATSLALSKVKSEISEYIPVCKPQSAYFHLLGLRDKLLKWDNPNFLSTAGPITKGPIPIYNSLNFELAKELATT